MAETRKRKAEERYGVVAESPRKCRGGSFDSTEGGDFGGEIGEDIMAWLTIDDDTTSELMKLLETEVDAYATDLRVRFIDNPYSRPLIFQSSSSYVTINGNEESCGSSFSDSYSSLMVSVDVHGINTASPRHLFSEEVKAVVLSSEEKKGGAWEMHEEEARGWEKLDWDDEMLDRFIGEGY